MNSAILKISGDIDFATVIGWRAEGEKSIAASSGVVFDFAEVTQANSAGLTLMLAWLRYATQKNKKIDFVNLPSSLITIAKVCDLTVILGMKANG